MTLSGIHRLYNRPSCKPTYDDWHFTLDTSTPYERHSMSVYSIICLSGSICCKFCKTI